jgi:hypothetical protein
MRFGLVEKKWTTASLSFSGPEKKKEKGFQKSHQKSSVSHLASSR